VSTKDDWKWRADLMQLVAKIKTNQDNHDEKFDDYVKISEKRLDRLEKTTFGLNGQPGLVEKTRVNKGWLTALVTGIAFVVTMIINAVMRAFTG